MPRISCTKFSAHLQMNLVIGCQVLLLTPISLIGNLGLEGGVLRLLGTERLWPWLVTHKPSVDLRVSFILSISTLRAHVQTGKEGR